MKTADRFLLQGFLSRTGLMLFLLGGVYVLSEVLNESGNLGEGQFGIVALGQYVGLRLPGILVEMAPFAVLLGTLVFLGDLARHAELTALRAGGMSLPRIVRPLLLGGLLVAGLTYGINDQAAGQLDSLADRFMQEKTKGKQPGRWLSSGGVWFRDGDWVISADRVARSGTELRGVRLFQRDGEGMLREVVEAARLHHANGEWRLDRAQALSTQSLEAIVPEEPLDLRADPEVLADLGKSPERMSFLRLWGYVEQLRAQGQPVNSLGFTLWQKVTLPLACAVMVLVAAPFVSLNPRGGGRVGRLLIGIGLGLVFHASNVLAGHLTAAGGLPPVAAAWMPIVGFSLLGGVLLLRAR